MFYYLLLGNEVLEYVTIDTFIKDNNSTTSWELKLTALLMHLTQLVEK